MSTKYSNFRLTSVTGKSYSEYRFKALVDETKGIFRKKTKAVEVSKTYAGSWFFTETGEFAPYEIAGLSRAYEGQQSKDLQDCKIEEP